MEIDEARTLKQQLGAYVADIMGTRAQAASAPTSVSEPGVRTGLALGVAPRQEGQFDVAVRYRLGTPTARMLARRLADAAGPGLDVRRTGRIVPLRSAGPRRPIPTALAAGETGRVRPLRPGLSIAHHTVTAGTLGGFVRVTDSPDFYALSNHHVLAGSLAARPGDAIVQPGPADGGRLPDDQVGELADFVPLAAGQVARADAAIARLADPDVDPAYPAGLLEGWAEVRGDEAVQKIGRTTGLTDGRVTAFELDDVVVGYGGDFGNLRFDDQIEVESTGSGPFSRGGDSGSIVYRPSDRRAVGLLFAGSETGGPSGTGLTYLNPLGTVLEALRATLT